MKHLQLLAAVCLVVFVSGCISTEDESPFTPSPFSDGPNDDADETPPPKRIADLLQESKQSYDDGHYVMAHRFAENAERLIRENKMDADGDRALALSIQGFCMIQLGQIEDYAIEDFNGVQAGAETKFNRALKIRPKDFRARLGNGLVKFIRHGHSIRKAISLDEGMIWLMEIKQAFLLSAEDLDDEDNKRLLRQSAAKYEVFAANRQKLLELDYIFRDPSTKELRADGTREQAAWLGNLAEDDAELFVNDIRWGLDAALTEDELTDDDVRRVTTAADALASNWKAVRNYWRMSALKDLQGARDTFLTLRKERPQYFWIDRDLVFVYESLGAFFLDAALEKARMQAIKEGAIGDKLEPRAELIYLNDDFNPWEKEVVRQNYADALKYIKAFVQRHKQFEILRVDARDNADYRDMNENPFLTDLVTRYRSLMDQLIEEGRAMRRKMVLEAAALVIDPRFQNVDLQQALVFAAELKANAPRDPMHHFVRAAAYFEDKDYEKALNSYSAFMRESSVVQHSSQRGYARSKISECEHHIKVNSGAAGGR